MAETFFNAISNKHKAQSAGIEKGKVTSHRLKDFPQHSNLFICMDEAGFDIRQNIAKLLTPEKVQKADKIIVMADRKLWPDYLRASDKIIFWPVADMCGQSLDKFRQARDQIKSLVGQLIKEL
ncbi:MAG: hypothetical protein GXP43_03180 [bacterium]|nr:hypothetical protein [bacterium]